MPANDIGIDMGTSSCLVYSTGKAVTRKSESSVGRQVVRWFGCKGRLL